MQRKLVQQGKSTLMVSLPSKWCKTHNLGKGDAVEIDADNTKLVIDATPKTNKPRTLKVTLSAENKEHLTLLMTHAYRKGYARIELKETDEQTYERVRSETHKRLLGWEVTHYDGNHCVIESVAVPSDEKYGALVQRLLLITTETLNALEQDASLWNKLKVVADYRDQHDRLVLYCKRSLASSASTEWEFLTFLMQIQHAAHYAYEYASKHEVKLDPRSKTLLKDLVAYFALLRQSYLREEIVPTYELNKLKGKYQFGKCYELMRSAKGDNAVFLAHVREAFRLIQLASSPLLAQHMDRALA